MAKRAKRQKRGVNSLRTSEFNSGKKKWALLLLILSVLNLYFMVSTFIGCIKCNITNWPFLTYSLLELLLLTIALNLCRKR